MNEKDRILAKLYKTLALNERLRDNFKADWRYIYNLLAQNEENKISESVLKVIEEWLNDTRRKGM